MNRLEQIGVVALLRATVPHLRMLGYGEGRIIGLDEAPALCATCGANVYELHKDRCEGAKLLRDVESAVREFG